MSVRSNGEESSGLKGAHSKIQVTHVIYLGSRLGSCPPEQFLVGDNRSTESHVLGGAETQLWLLLPELVRQGCDVELIVLVWHPSIAVNQALERLEQTGVRVVRLERASFNSRFNKYRQSFLTYLHLHQELCRRRERWINFHLDHFFTPLVGRLAGCRKALFSFHADHPLYSRWSFQLFHRVQRMCGFFCGFTALSKHVQHYVIENLSLPISNCRIVRYGIDLRLKRDLSARRVYRGSKYGINSSKPVIGFVGRLVPQKNLPFLISAMAELPELDLVIAGGGPLRSELQEQVKREGLLNVFFIGPVQSGRDFIESLDLLVLPSTWEGLGLVLLEALASGVPVAGSIAGAIPEVLGHGAIGELFSPYDRAQLVAAIRRAIAEDNPQRATSQEWIQSNYSLKAAAMDYVDSIEAFSQVLTASR